MPIPADPFRELDRLTQSLTGAITPSVAPMDAYRQGDDFVVHIDLPGLDPSSIEVTAEKNVLSATTCSPSSLTMTRRVPCVAGCWGPRLRTMPSLSSSTLMRMSAAWPATYASRCRSLMAVMALLRPTMPCPYLGEAVPYGAHGTVLP